MAELSLPGRANGAGSVPPARRQFVSVRFAGRDLRLPHVLSGSGARYSDGKTTFWNRGRSVLMEVDDKIVVQDCMLQ